MEKQLTSKFLRSVIAVVALFMLAVSGFLLTSCKEEECSHSTTNDFGACTECNVIVDWAKYEAKLDGLISPNFTDLTASLDSLKSEVSDVVSDVDSVIAKIGDIDLGADITTIVDTVNDVLDEVVAMLGAEKVTDKATPATITGIAKALDTLQTSINKVQQDITGVEKVCTTHDFDTSTLIEIIPASCTDPGLGYYRCKNCNAVVSDEIPTIPHTPGEPVKENEKAATCTEAGSYDEVVYCTVCEDEISRVEKTVDALDHAWDEGEVTTQPTCIAEGVKTFTCTRCDETKTEPVPATGHTADWSAPTESVKPTCVVDGSATFKCTNCDDTFTLNPSDETTKPEFMSDEDWAAFVAAYEATGHDLSRQEEVWENVKLNQTDEKTGQIVDQVDRVTYKYCTNEGCNYKEEVGRVTENHQLYVSKELTFFEGNGDVREVSKLSDEELTKYELKEGGKNFGKIKDGYVNVSCTETAYLFYLCPDECAMKPDNPIKVELEAFAPEHNFVVAGEYVEGEEPTCTEGGKQIYTCAYCDEETIIDVAPLGHTMPESGVTHKDPTCTEKGYDSYICTVCGVEQKEDIDPLDHAYQPTGTKVVYVDNNMHNVITTYTCTRCGDTKTEGEDGTANEPHKALVFNTLEEAEAANVKYEYSFNIYKAEDGKFYFTDASCDDPGVRIYLCECGYWYGDTDFATKYVPQLSHEYGEAVVVKGDCVTGGYSIFVCERCGVSYTVTYDQAKGHDWEVVAAKDPTCDTNGWEGFAYCKTCGKVVMFAAADENSKPDAMLTDYVEGVTCDGTEEEIEAVKDLKGIAIDALGHLWSSEPKVFCEVGCLSPVWEVTYCVRCFNYDAEGDFTIKANGAEYPEPANGYVDTDFGAATDEFINELLKVLNWAGSDDVPAVSFTKEQLLSDDFNGHYNITGIKFVAAKGHTLTKYQSVLGKDLELYEGAADTAKEAKVCVTDTNLIFYDLVWGLAQNVCPTVDETAFKAAFDAIFGEGKSDDMYFMIDTTGKTTPTLAGVCKDCGMPIAVTEHDVVYNMYVVTNGVNGAAYVPGEDINYNTAHVSETLFYVVDKDGNLRVDENGTPIGMTNEQIAAQSDYTKAVFTKEQIITFGYYKMDANGEFLAVNCYFYSYCANCNKYDGTDRNHGYPTPDQWDKYQSCMQGRYCLWCDSMFVGIGDHNMVDLEEIAASDNEKFAAAAKLYAATEEDPVTFDWVGKDTVADMPCEDAEGNTNIAEK